MLKGLLFFLEIYIFVIVVCCNVTFFVSTSKAISKWQESHLSSFYIAFLMTLKYENTRSTVAIETERVTNKQSIYQSSLDLMSSYLLRQAHFGRQYAPPLLPG